MIAEISLLEGTMVEVALRALIREYAHSQDGYDYAEDGWRAE
jgi:hypothetical protein